MDTLDRHVEDGRTTQYTTGRTLCAECEEPWPCSVQRLRAEVERLTDECEGRVLLAVAKASKDADEYASQVERERDDLAAQVAVLVEALNHTASRFHEVENHVAVLAVCPRAPCSWHREALANLPAAAREYAAKVERYEAAECIAGMAASRMFAPGGHTEERG